MELTKSELDIMIPLLISELRSRTLAEAESQLTERGVKRNAQMRSMLLRALKSTNQEQLLIPLGALILGFFDRVPKTILNEYGMVKRGKIKDKGLYILAQYALRKQLESCSC